MHLPQIRPLFPELRQFRQSHLSFSQCSRVHWRERSLLLSSLSWSATMLYQLEYQIQDLDDYGNWQKYLQLLLSLYLCSHYEEAEPISPISESGWGLFWPTEWGRSDTAPVLGPTRPCTMSIHSLLQKTATTMWSPYDPCVDPCVIKCGFICWRILDPTEQKWAIPAEVTLDDIVGWGT